MNFGKLLNFISDNNINPEEIFSLVDKVKNSDLKDETNIRSIIHEVSKIAGKPIDKAKEDKLVKKILSDGVNEDIIDML